MPALIYARINTQFLYGLPSGSWHMHIGQHTACIKLAPFFLALSQNFFDIVTLSFLDGLNGTKSALKNNDSLTLSPRASFHIWLPRRIDI